MRDFAISDDPVVQAQLDRLAALSVPRGRLSLDPVRAMLARLGDPHSALPPVFHVAGTNGKGSTCAFLRAMLEAQGHRVHVYTSPHLVRFNERIRVAGKLIDDAALATLLAEVLDAAGGIGASFFEVTTAAAFLAFARAPAAACVIEVGLGGRLDATNVLDAPAACGIASLGIDHEAFLLAPEHGAPPAPLARIAWEKAHIAKRGVPLVMQAYDDEAGAIVARTAAIAGARLLRQDIDWRLDRAGDHLFYYDHNSADPLVLPLPALAGEHQFANAGLAIAMLRHQSAVPVGSGALARGLAAARWPARLQRLGDGPLTRLVPGRAVWLDGGHNPDAGAALARHFAGCDDIHLLIGMLAGKDPRAIVEPLADRLASLTALPIPGHEAHPPERFAQLAEALRPPFGRAESPEAALAALPGRGDVLIAGSLYLAGEVLRLNREFPD